MVGLCVCMYSVMGIHGLTKPVWAYVFNNSIIILFALQITENFG